MTATIVVASVSVFLVLLCFEVYRSIRLAAVHDVARAVEEEAVEAALRERSSRRRSTAAGLDPGRSRRGSNSAPDSEDPRADRSSSHRPVPPLAAIGRAASAKHLVHRRSSLASRFLPGTGILSASGSGTSAQLLTPTEAGPARPVDSNLDRQRGKESAYPAGTPHLPSKAPAEQVVTVWSPLPPGRHVSSPTGATTSMNNLNPTYPRPVHSMGAAPPPPPKSSWDAAGASTTGSGTRIRAAEAIHTKGQLGRSARVLSMGKNLK